VSAQDAWARELAVARAAVARAAGEVRAGRGRGWASLRTKTSLADLVTDVDVASERLLRQALQEAFPDDVVVAEETAPALAAAPRRWLVDPLDGTVNFVHGYPFVAVSVALVDADGPAVGVIAAPFLGEEFWAVRGGGAYRNGERLRTSGVDTPERALLATGFPFKPGKGDPHAYFALLADLTPRIHGLRRAGSAALDLAYVATGQLDGFFELGLAPWDVAAGLLLVQEAGGCVGPWPGRPGPPWERGDVLAGTQAVFAWLQEALAPYTPRL
jgi:myo-inositol-1(or 4)-monophosphatase